MKQTKELSDHALNLKIAESSGDYSEGYFDKNPQNVPDFTGDWNLLMPLVTTHGIGFFQSTSRGTATGNMYAVDLHKTIEIMTCNNPQRALAECLLLTLNK